MDAIVFSSLPTSLEIIFGYGFGTPPFNLLFAFCVVVWVLVARVLLSVCSSRRGLPAAFFGLALSAVMAYGCSVLSSRFGVPYLKVDWAADVLPALGFVLGFVLAVAFFLTRIWQLSAVVCLFIFALASASSCLAFFGAEFALNVVAYGEEHLDQRERTVEDTFNSLF